MNLFKLAKNAAYLMLSQIATYIVPFVTLPYLSRTLSLPLFGEVMTFIALIQFGYIFSEFGFNISATKEIIDSNNDKYKIRITNGSVYIIKIVSVAIYSFLIFLFFYDKINIYILLLIYLSIFFQGIQPVWVFNAEEKFKELSIVLLLGKLTYIPLIYYFVKDTSDVADVLFFLLLSQIITFIIAYYKFNEYFKFKILKENVIYLINISYSYFIARITTNIQYYMLVPIVSYFLGPVIAGQFSNSDNLSKSVRGLSGSIIQVLFPAISKSKDMKMFLLFTVTSTLVLFFICLLLSLSSENIITFIFGDSFEQSIIYFKYLIFSVVLFYVNGCLGYPLFSMISKLEYVNVTSIVGGVIFVIGLVVNIIIRGTVEPLDIIFLLFASEISVMLLRVVIFWKKHNECIC